MTRPVRPSASHDERERLLERQAAIGDQRAREQLERTRARRSGDPLLVVAQEALKAARAFELDDGESVVCRIRGSEAQVYRRAGRAVVLVQPWWSPLQPHPPVGRCELFQLAWDP